MFRGKNYKDSVKLIDKSTQYEAKDAFELVVKTAKAKFDETVELHVKLGVDSRHADQQVRGAIVLPNGTGKTMRVLVFCKDERVQEACKPEKSSARMACMARSSFSHGPMARSSCCNSIRFIWTADPIRSSSRACRRPACC